MEFQIAIIIVSLYFLTVISKHFFMISLEIISEKMKFSSDMAGATLMAIGSSTPEFFTMLFAIFRNEDIGAGTIIGSAIFNILVIIGVASFYSKTKLQWQPIIRDLVFYSLSILLLLFAFQDGQIELYESILFICIYVIYIIAVSRWRKWFKYKQIQTIENMLNNHKLFFLEKFVIYVINFIVPKPNQKNALLTFIMSILLIGVFSFLLVDTSIHLGKTFNISPTFFGLTVLAIGTSIPDLMSVIFVSKKGKSDMAVTNAIGSNVFDILFGLGLPWLIYFAVNGVTVYTVENKNLEASVLLLFSTVITLLGLLIAREWKLSKLVGVILISVYIGYITYNFLQIL